MNKCINALYWILMCICAIMIVYFGTLYISTSASPSIPSVILNNNYNEFLPNSCVGIISKILS